MDNKKCKENHGSTAERNSIHSKIHGEREKKGMARKRCRGVPRIGRGMLVDNAQGNEFEETIPSMDL
jgi:hypothetical protein